MWKAAQEYGSLEKSLDRLHINFDRMRSSEGNEVTHDTDDQQSRRDERLALLLAITACADWITVQRHLAKHNFNLVEAIVAWYAEGITSIAATKKDRKTRLGPSNHSLPMPSTNDVAPAVDDEWADEPDFCRRVKDFDNSALVPLPGFRNEEREARVFGFLIDPDKSAL
jgi:hypothetical protein